MGCFCFGSSKHRRRSKRALISPSHHQIQEGASGSLVPPEPAKDADTELPPELTTAPNCDFSLEEKLPVEQLEVVGGKKKVAFDLTVKTYELPAEEVCEDFPERDETDETAEDDETQREGALHTDYSTPCAGRVSSYPLSHRYHNCASSGDECEDTVTEGIDDDGEDDGSDQNKLLGQQTVIEQESSGSLFSLPIDSRKHASAANTEEKEVNSPMPVADSEDKEWRSDYLNPNVRPGNQCVHSALNPVANCSRLEKEVKARYTSPPKNHEKENLNIKQDFAFSSPFRSEPAPKLLNQSPSELIPKEIAVDTSLSSWLSISETTPKSKTVGNSPSLRANTPRSAEDRLILGVLTMEDLRQLSASNSPIRSRGRSPDDKPIIGTVGSYWSHTGQAMDLDSCSSRRGMKSSRINKEEQRMNLVRIPFEARLESTL
ncbi:uncharacterized protein LOC116207693 isoform X1 [Punica granatum]|uniref:Uncharacterized protein LOC116207693 isoform X1 n=1 Tax=Punica granatum TaxID=22663 RepID=A0A6P8DTR3_PUNGR|nr:uncharacterized protein LOC116207693 isoform X1 [Punica granatum]